MTILSRRSLLAASIAITALTAGAVGPVWAQSKEVIMQDPGGAYGEALREVMFDPFEKETGIKVVTVQEARSGPRIKAQVEAGRTEWDQVFIFDQETKLLGDCCLDKIDYSKLDESAQKTLASMPENLKRPNGVALQVIGIGLAFRAVFGEFEPPWLARAIATLFIVAGAALAVAAQRRACRTMNRLESHQFAAASIPRFRLLAWAVVFGSAMLVAGLWVLNDGQIAAG